MSKIEYTIFRTLTDSNYPKIEDINELQNYVKSLSKDLKCYTTNNNHLKSIDYQDALDPSGPHYTTVTLPMILQNDKYDEQFFSRISEYTQPFYTLCCQGGFPKFDSMVIGQNKGIGNNKKLKLIYVNNGSTKSRAYTAKEALSVDWEREAKKLSEGV